MNSDRIIAQALGDGRPLTYRVLSRLAKVHVNRAKQMLADYLETHPKAHATYILSGPLKAQTLAVVTNGHLQTEANGNGMDVDPSPDASAEVDVGAVPELVELTGFRLVQAADVESGKALFERVTSQHIYSLEATALRDIVLATTANDLLATDERCTAAWKGSKNGALFGVIQHPTRQLSSRAAPGLPKASTSKPVKPESKPAPKRKAVSEDEDDEPVVAKSKPSSGKGKGRAVIESDDEASEASSAPKSKPSSKGKAKATVVENEPAAKKPKAKKVKRSASGRRIREVTRRTKDAKGRIVMETVEESYSESDGEEAKPAASTTKAKPKVKSAEDKPAKPKPSSSKPASKPKLKADENGQTGLGSFFSKAPSKKK